MERSMTATRKQAAVIGQQQPASPATRLTCIYFAAAYLPFTCDTGLCFQIGMKNKVLHAFFSPLDLTWSTSVTKSSPEAFDLHANCLLELKLFSVSMTMNKSLWLS